MDFNEYKHLYAFAVGESWDEVNRDIIAVWVVISTIYQKMAKSANESNLYRLVHLRNLHKMAHIYAYHFNLDVYRD